MRYLILFSVVILSIILVTNYDSVFATHMDSHHDDDQMEQLGMMNENVMENHHMSYKGMCAPGFASLDGMCVLDDRCGPGVYAGKICMMDGIMKQYLRPLHQKYAGISVDNIICAEGKQVMFKHHDASPACINSNSVEKLKHRGWQSEKPPIACTMEWNPVCGVDGNTYGNLCMLDSADIALDYQGECTDIAIDDLPTITITGTISHWQPIDGPSYAITPEEDLTVPMDEGKIYLYGDILDESLDGKQVKITGKIVENYGEYRVSKYGGPSLGGDPSTSAIFVTDPVVMVR